MSSALPARQTISIGEVLGQLRPDFPDVTISKIRFLESEGLIEPQRSPSGYRRFSHDDIARLRYVLTVQRDHYLPLRVIKQQLERLDDGMEFSFRGAGLAHRTAWRVRPGMATRSGCPARRCSRLPPSPRSLLAELESYGLVTARGATFDASALLVARTAGELAGYGLEPRHLRTIRSAAEREVDLIEQVVAPMLRQRGAEARGRGEETAREIARLTTRLHTAIVAALLRRVRTG